MIQFPMMDPLSYVPSDDWDLFSVPSHELDMYEEEGNLVVELEASGFSKDDLKISFDAGTVKITGKTKKEEKEEEQEGRRYFRREIQKRSFTRRIDLPVAVDVDKAKAKFEDGVLKLTMPKLEESEQESKAIAIE